VSFGAVMDNPDLIVTCIVGDGEAETGPTATFVPYSSPHSAQL
jgi:xylulose-5-phosphate/fructose-6-phosphate phosphoketolase